LIRKNIRRPVQLRVFNVLKNWIDKHYIDFEESQSLLNQLQHFVNDTMMKTEEMEKPAESLSNVLKKKKEEEAELKTKRITPVGPGDNVPAPNRQGVISGFIDLLEVWHFHPHYRRRKY